MSLRCRPGPLQELDLHLVPVPSGIPGHSRKRPHSPSVSSVDSPAKRRLKAEQGSRGSKLKSPLSTSSNSARFAPAHFHALLQGPDSPAKRLDFGSSEASDTTVCEVPRSGGSGSGTPRRSPKRTSAARVRRSPRLSARAQSSALESSRSSPTGQTGADTTVPIHASITTPIVIPRVVTPPDRQSIHYPGFDVYQDPHFVLPTARSPSTPNDDASLPSLSDKEHDKENTAPRRRSSKKATQPATPSDTAWLKVGLMSPSVKESVKKHIPASPHPKHVRDYLATPNVRTVHPAVSPAATLVGVTPGRTPLSKEERKQMRRALEDEVDDVDGEDEFLM